MTFRSRQSSIITTVLESKCQTDKGKVKKDLKAFKGRIKKLKINHDHENQKHNKLEQKEQRTVEFLTGPPLHFRSKKVIQTVPVSQVSKHVNRQLKKTNLCINSINSMEKEVNKDNIQSERQQLNGRRSVTAIFNDLYHVIKLKNLFWRKAVRRTTQCSTSYNHIVLIQEHWLFQCQIYQIGEIDSNICFAAKGVDINNPIQPTQLPRGYVGGGCIME